MESLQPRARVVVRVHPARVGQAQHAKLAGEQVGVELEQVQARLEVGVEAGAARKAGAPVATQVGGAAQRVGLVKAVVAEVVRPAYSPGVGKAEGKIGRQVSLQLRGNAAVG